MRRANYSVVLDPAARRSVEADALVIRDCGPWDKFFTVTNAVEEVVEQLRFAGLLRPGRRLFCYDSSGDLDEIVLTADGRFALGPRQNCPICGWTKGQSGADFCKCSP